MQRFTPDFLGPTRFLKDFHSPVSPEWPPTVTLFEMIDGLYDGSVLQTESEVRALLDMLQAELQLQPNITRASLRVFVQNDVFDTLPPELLNFFEARVPLAGTLAGLENASLVYLGINTATRQSNEHDLVRIKENIAAAQKKSTITYAEILQRLDQSGFKSQVLSVQERTQNPEVLHQLKERMSRFGWSDEEILEHLQEEKNILCVIWEGENIASMVTGIISDYLVGAQPFRMAEITEATTETNYAGQGLYTAVMAILLEELAFRHVNLAYGECNGLSLPVLIASQKVGRSIAESPSGGFLAQHWKVAGSDRKGEYNDLVVSSISLEQMRSFIATRQR